MHAPEPHSRSPHSVQFLSYRREEWSLEPGHHPNYSSWSLHEAAVSERKALCKRCRVLLQCMLLVTSAAAHVKLVFIPQSHDFGDATREINMDRTGRWHHRQQGKSMEFLP